MAGGGLIQLVSIGAQDVYLVGNPQITFFKVTYQRHTNFARECIEQQVLGTPGFQKTVSVIISRSGDLVGPMHAEFDLPALPSGVTAPGNVYSSGVVTGTSVAGTYSGSNSFNWCWVNYIGFRLLKEVTIEIGGQPIDRHYSTWFYMWFELSTPASKREGLQRMVGGYDITEVPLGLTTNAINKKTVYVPLVFWFNTHPGLALPLIALQYHEVKISISIEALDNCVVLLEAATSSGAAFSNVLDLHWRNHQTGDFAATSLTGFDLHLWADYYYLDSEERKRFAQNSHEYLIKQVQAIENPAVSATGAGSIDYKTFNHPISFHVWGFRRQSPGATADWTNFTNSPPFLQFLGNSIVDEHRLTLNGNDRYTSKKVDYYNLVQPYNHFTAIPPVGVLTYSYAIQPVEHQPSGSLNFSRIDNAANRFTTIVDGTLNGLLGVSADAVWKGDTYTGIVFGVNYNVLRIMSGMGGLAYSN